MVVLFFNKNNFIYYWLINSYLIISKKSSLKYFKYIFRCFKNWSINYRWIKYINKTEQHQRWKEYSGCDFFLKMQYPYLSLSFNKYEKYNVLTQHYDWVFLNFKEEYLYKKVKLFSYLFHDETDKQEEVEVYIKFKGPFEYEGEMSMFMKVNGEIQYTLTFISMIENNVPSFFIGGLQAGKPDITNLETLKKLTKLMHGLRPKQFILYSLSFFASQMNINQIIAVSNENHVFSKVQKRWSKKQVKTSLNDFWEEFEAQKNNSNNYIFKPLSAKIDLEKIVSKKRSQYRKRQLILDDLGGQIGKNISEKMKI